MTVKVGVRPAAVAVVALIAGLVLGWSALIPVALVFLGAAYAIRLGLDDPNLDLRAPLVAAGLLLVAELAYWSLEEREEVRSEPGESLRRTGFVAFITLAAVIVGAVLLTVADVARTTGLAIDLLGAAAAVAALFVLVAVSRRPA